MTGRMFVVSTSTKTVLSEFANLETSAIYEHTNGETSDFQFFSKHGLFVEINVKGGLEIMRIKEKAHKMHLQKVRKLAVEALTSVACAKQSSEEIAVGMANGCVSLYNINSAKNLHRFKADASRTAVSYLDYNLSDEYLAAVYESGLINIYGMTTKAKIESINIDGNSLLARFHPTKRFLLGIASNKGTVTVYDTQMKKKVFNVVNKHAAPCRDLCFSIQNPHSLVSVGYDCIVNIFDTRRRGEPDQFTSRYPLSTVGMSECGTYICMGNLKGELSALDRRNLKKTLAVVKAHDSGIHRLAFVPNFTELRKSTSSGLFSDQSGVDNSHNEKTNNDGADFRRTSFVSNKLQTLEELNTPPSALKTTSPRVRDSMCDYLDNLKHSEMPSFPLGPRESFDWNALGRNNDFKSGIYQTMHSLSSILSNTSNASPGLDSFDSKLGKNDNDVLKLESSNAGLNQTGTVSNLSVDFDIDNKTKEIIKLPKLVNDDKENRPNRMSENLPLPEFSNNNSTPLSKNSNSNIINNANINKIINANMNSSSDPNLNSNSNANVNFNSNCTDEIKAYIGDQMDILRSEVTDKINEVKGLFKRLEGELNYVAENNKWAIISQNALLSIKHTNALTNLDRNMKLLMQTDPFVSEFFRLKAENEELKKQLNKLTQN